MVDEDGSPGVTGPRRPSVLSMVAGAVVAAGAVLVGGALLLSSGLRDLIGGDDGDDLDVALVGDSFAAQSGDQFLALGYGRGLYAEVYAYGGTAICGWEDELHDLAEREPEQLVLSFAGNDQQSCINPDDTRRAPEAVAADYRRDLDDVIDLFRGTGTDIYVVDPPPIRDPQFEANAAAMRDMYRDAAIAHPSIRVIDPNPRLGPDGGYHTTLPCETGEQCGPDGVATLRQDDGIHLTPAGGRRYAEAIFDVLGPADRSSSTTRAADGRT